MEFSRSRQVGFAKAAHKLDALSYSPLGVEETGWARDFAEYSTAVGVLERRFAATASAAVDRAGSLQARMELIMVRHQSRFTTSRSYVLEGSGRFLYHDPNILLYVLERRFSAHSKCCSRKGWQPASLHGAHHGAHHLQKEICKGWLWLHALKEGVCAAMNVGTHRSIITIISAC